MKEVHKFGGTSVDKMEQVIKVIISRKDKNPYVTVSAFSGFTDKLLECIDLAENQKPFDTKLFDAFIEFHLKKIEEGSADKETANFLKEKFAEFFQKNSPRIQRAYENIIKKGYSAKDHDTILGFGEQISAFVLSELLTLRLKSEERKGKFIDLGEAVNADFSEANHVFLEALKESVSKKVIDEKEDDEILIMTGFIGAVPGGILHSIDRGYTDFTGAFVSALLHAKRYIIFKEVDGVCSADPRIVTKGCLLLKELSYTEVLKMASGGMKAVNTEAVKPAMKESIPIEVRNLMSPEKEGTIILASREMQENRYIQNIPVKKGVCIIRFGGYNDSMESNLEMKLLSLLDKHKIRRFFSTSDGAGTSVVLPFHEKKIEMLMDDLSVFGVVKIIKDCGIIAIVGEEMRGQVGVIAKASDSLAAEGISIHMIAQGASEIGIDFVIPEERINDAIGSLHKTFFS